MNNGELKARVAPVLTLNNARAWFRETEKWIFVTGLLRDVGIDYAPHANSVGRYVHRIEREFDRILIAAGE